MTSPFKPPVVESENDDGASRETDSLQSGSFGATLSMVVRVAPPGTKKRFMLIDETQLPPEEAERLLLKRAYNRECADRARKRSKGIVCDLHRQIDDLQEDKSELRRSIANRQQEIETLKKEIEALQSRNSTHAVNDMIPRLYNNNNSWSTLEVASANSYAPPLVQQQADQTLGELPPGWDMNKLLLLQQLRKQN